MDERIDNFEGALQQTVARFSFAWLVLANLVGVWLSVLLIWPEMGTLTGAFTYGRWMPLHMDWHLYGWCSLPLVGLLMHFMLQRTSAALIEARWALTVWSLALLVLGAYCLMGQTSGKLFLNWTGFSRVLFPSAQFFLWGVLVVHWVKGIVRNTPIEAMDWLKGGILVGLLASPIALFITSDPAIYPPIDPDSGGATGHSLLASSLGILVLFGLLPRMLGIADRPQAQRMRRIYFCAIGVSFVGWALIDHGNASNQQVDQIIGLAILVLWMPIVAVYFRAFAWEGPTRWWCLAFVFWWLLLTLDGFLSFLPPVLTLTKFTNSMVAHAHMAMAGMLSSLNMVILSTMGPARQNSPWGDLKGFFLWNAGTLIYCFFMTIQGFREGIDPFVLVGSDDLTSFLYLIRTAAGLFMLWASIRWLYYSIKQ
jgi:cytochrome c oxidase cbb3-type subunit 1